MNGMLVVVPRRRENGQKEEKVEDEDKTDRVREGGEESLNEESVHVLCKDKKSQCGDKNSRN